MATSANFFGSTDNTAAQTSLTIGTPVFDVNNEKIGTVGEEGAQGGYLLVQKGIFFPKDMYVPLNAITSADANGVYLSVTKAEVEAGTWDNVPQMTGSFAPVIDEEIIDTRATRPQTTGRNTVRSDTEDLTVPVREEELVVGTREQEMGRVHVHKDVIAEQETISAPVTREQVTIERVPVNADIAATDLDADAFVEKNIDIPLMGEELVAGKRTVVTEEVRIRKHEITEDQQVTDTVRREHVTVEGADDQQTRNRQRDRR